MSQPHIVRFQSITALRSAAKEWNDLWQRRPALADGPSRIHCRLGGAICATSHIHSLAVEHDGQLVAGLPLVERRVARLIKAGSLPSNSSCWAGGLLVDPTSNVADAFSTLLSEVRRLPWSMLWFDMAPLESAGWRQFLAAMDELKFSYQAHERFQIGTIQIVEQFDRDWDAYEAAWSGNHRRHLRSAPPGRE